MPNLAPSERLLREVQRGHITWKAFGRRYQQELFLDGAVDRSNRSVKNHGQKFTLRFLKAVSKGKPVTLMCHCAEDQPMCHRHLLRRLLASKRI